MTRKFDDHFYIAFWRTLYTIAVVIRTD